MNIRKVFLFALLLLSGLTLLACTKTEDTVLRSLTFEGVGDVEVDFQAPFNVLTGVRAKGNDGKYYDEDITFVSLAQAKGEIDEEGNLDTTIPQTISVNYKVKVGAVQAEKFRTITVKSPVPTGDEMVFNGDFAIGIAGWNDSAVNYIADGASMTLTVENGELKAEVVAGANAFTPRFGQQNIKFENGKTYEVSFKAKSLEAKRINLQVGELLTAAPWFDDFKPQQDIRKDITTEWASYSYKFTMNKPTNERGAILFELGTIDSQAVNTTLWFDDIKVVESTPDADTEGPVLSGILLDQNVLLGSTFDPKAGVTAFDVGDNEDLTDQIDVKIYNALNELVESLDTSFEQKYKLIYTVEDSKGNKTTKEAFVHVVGLIFNTTNIIKNGDFKLPFGEAQAATWNIWYQDWGSAPQVSVNHNQELGEVTLDITGGGDAAWAVQFTQPETAGLTLVLGKTYKVVLEVKAEAQRAFNIGIGYGDPFVQYARKDGLVAQTEKTTLEFVFTNKLETHDVRFVFELGNNTNFADGEFTIYKAAIYELAQEDVIKNGNFDVIGWRGFVNDWEGSLGTFGIVSGEFVFNITKYVNTGNTYSLQIIQDMVAMGGKTEVGVIELEPNTTYTWKFDMYASKDIAVSPLIISSNDWVNLVKESDRTVNITTTKSTYTITFTTGTVVHGNEILKFELGSAFASFEGEEFIKLDNVFITKEGSETLIPSVYNPTMDEVIGFSLFTEGLTNSMAFDENSVIINIEQLGGEAYTPHFYQDGISLAAGNYTLRFEISASVSRDIRVNLILPNANYTSILPDGFVDKFLTADEHTVIEIDFTLAQLTEGIKLEIDFGTLGGELTSLPGTFVIDSVLIYPNY